MKFEDLEFERKLHMKRALVQVIPGGLVAAVYYDQMRDHLPPETDFTVTIGLHVGDKSLIEDLNQLLLVQGVEGNFTPYFAPIKRSEVGRWLDLLSQSRTHGADVMAQALYEGKLRLAKPAPAALPLFWPVN